MSVQGLNEVSEQSSYRQKFDALVELAKALMLKDGYHIPTLIVEGKRGQRILQLTELAASSQLRKHQLYELGTKIGLEHPMGKLQHLFLIAEGWVSRVSPEAKVTRRSDNDSRREVLIVMGYETKSRQITTASFEIIRDHRKVPYRLCELTHTEDGMTAIDSDMLGAFVNAYSGTRGN